MRSKRPCGFTIPELLLSSIVVGFTFVATVTAYIMLDKIWREDETLNELVRNTNIACEKIIRGVHGNEGLQAAKSISSPLAGASSDTVQYLDLNNVSRSFYLSDSNVYAGDGSVILEDAESCTFTNVDDETLAIDLITRKYVVDKLIRFELKTTVKLRNG